MFAFGSFRAAVLAEPTVTEIEKVIGLGQVKAVTGVGYRAPFRVSGARFHSSYRLKTPRLVSGPCVRRTGMVVRLPFLTIST